MQSCVKWKGNERGLQQLSDWRPCELKLIKQVAVLDCRISSTHLHGMSSAISSTLSVHRHFGSFVIISLHIHNGVFGNLLLSINFSSAFTYALQKEMVLFLS